MLPKYYNENDITDNLYAAGCDEHTVNKVLDCCRNDRLTDEIKILNDHRRKLLDEVHKTEKKISYLDYLIFRIENEK